MTSRSALYALNHRVNLLRDYLITLQWDGVQRIDTLLTDYFGAEDTIYAREAIRKCLVAAIARLFNPGVKFDQMLILAGPQGIGKSTFFRFLGMRWYTLVFPDTVFSVKCKGLPRHTVADHRPFRKIIMIDFAPQLGIVLYNESDVIHGA